MTRRTAINDKCRECIYDPIGGSGNWRQQITACTSTTCPLFPFRPVSKPHSARGASEKVCSEAKTVDFQTSKAI